MLRGVCRRAPVDENRRPDSPAMSKGGAGPAPWGRAMLPRYNRKGLVWAGEKPAPPEVEAGSRPVLR